ncbi:MULTISPECIES: hypothetical protein [Bacillaceae]|uniref:DUF3139 domain-containing protein n=1 Tax=Peribacillus huizhouensis TaxID=1501239 RepID=A0ABR6CM29_9BACI|nr:MULTISPECIES: hypothetical protein [Bacillaceae]MBA9026077.1 hypothetical protein [Peribacillus huizhouensis]
MYKYLHSFSIIFFGICVLLGSWFISQSLKSNQDKQEKISKGEQYRYELLSPNENNLIIFDKQSGDYWRKFIESGEGPTEWEKQPSPISETLE